MSAAEKLADAVRAILDETKGQTVQAVQMHIGGGRWVHCLLVGERGSDCAEAVRRLEQAAEPQSIHTMPGWDLLDAFADGAALAGQPEVSISEVLAARVRAGEPIHVSGPLTGTLGKVHIAAIEKVRAETGLPVHVVFSS